MDRHALLQRALRLSLLSIALGALFGGTAVIVGLATDSLSLLGFGIDAAIDSVASVILVWRFRTEVHEPHRAERIESLAERAIGAVLLLLVLIVGLGLVSGISGLPYIALVLAALLLSLLLVRRAPATPPHGRR